MTSPRESTSNSTVWPWWHLIGLWSLVVAQPVYDVLRQNGDFFVAHRTSPTNLGLLLLSDVWPKFVIYGRTARFVVPFVCLAAAFSAACQVIWSSALPLRRASTQRQQCVDEINGRMWRCQRPQVFTHRRPERGRFE